MKKKIYTNILLVGILSVLVTSVLNAVVYYSVFERQVKADLQSNLQAVSAAADAMGEPEQIDGLLASFGSQEDLRLTYIAPDGTVLFDSESDAGTMDSYADRPEIEEALASGSAQTVRKSGTPDQNTYYCAQLLENGNVIRAAVRASAITQIFYESVYYIALILLAVLLLSLLLANRLTKNITKPIAQMANDMEKLEETGGIYPELRPFAKQIHEQQHRQKEVEKIKRQFTANVSHELKTPLTSIMGYAQLLESGVVEEGDISKFAGTISREAQRLISLTGDIIQLSQLEEEEQQEQEAAMGDTDLYQCAQNVLQSLRMQAEKRGITMELQGGTAVMRANRGLMEDLIYNLCENAIRYNKEGGTVTIFAGQEKIGILLRISDTGIGIPKKYQERVFERFYRVDKSRSKETGGTGLGLAIVKHIVEYHDGTIHLESEEGKGTCIEVRFAKPQQQLPTPAS